MKAPVLTELAAQWLRARLPEAHIVREFSCAAYGGALIDVAAICEDQIIGVEVKGEGDSPSRLKLQGNMYSRVCRQVYLLPSPDLQDRCIKHCPPEWQIITTKTFDSWAGLNKCADTDIYYPKNMRSLQPWSLVRGDGYGLAPAALTELVWTKEYRKFAHALEPYSGLPRKKADALRAVCKHFPVDTVERAVCSTLRRRNWEMKPVDKPAEAA